MERHLNQSEKQVLKHLRRDGSELGILQILNGVKGSESEIKAAIRSLQAQKLLRYNQKWEYYTLTKQGRQFVKDVPLNYWM